MVKQTVQALFDAETQEDTMPQTCSDVSQQRHLAGSKQLLNIFLLKAALYYSPHLGPKASKH